MLERGLLLATCRLGLAIVTSDRSHQKIVLAAKVMHMERGVVRTGTVVSYADAEIVRASPAAASQGSPVLWADHRPIPLWPGVLAAIVAGVLVPCRRVDSRNVAPQFRFPARLECPPWDVPDRNDDRGR